MEKNVPLAISHPSCSDFFQNLHDGDECTTDVVTMGGPMETTVEIHTSALVLDLFLTYDPFAISLQDAMVIILKRSQDQTFSAPEEWATCIKQGKAEGMIEEAMLEFVADTALEVSRKIRLDYVVSLVSPRVEVQTDEA
jgi:hypothetical protein